MATLRKRGKNWFIRYTASNGKKREVKGCPDRRETEAMARELESEAARERAGIFDPYRVHRGRPLVEHLEEYLSHLEANGDTTKHLKLVRSRLTRILEGCDFHKITDLDAPRVATWLAAQRKPVAAGGVNMSVQTSNHYTTNVKSFARWLVEHRRRPDNPLLSLEPGNVQTDRRLVRRALLENELLHLLDATRLHPPLEGMPGPERCVLYLLASVTGYRRGELAVLTPADFRLDVPGPSIILAAEHTKNRKAASQPIPPPLVEPLRFWLAGKAPGSPVFNPMPAHTGRMLKADLRRCGIDVVDSDGREVDMHALRAGFISMLARAGTQVKVLQQLARHSDPRLTLGVYTHLSANDTAAAVETLPNFAHHLPTGHPGEQQTTTGNSGAIATSDTTAEAQQTPENKANSGQRRVTSGTDMVEDAGGSRTHFYGFANRRPAVGVQRRGREIGR